MTKETAMKILKELHSKSLFAERTALETLIPELKENEDERVKKRILLSLEKDLMATKNSGCSTKDLEDCIAWLEKQGESYTKKDIDDAYMKGICVAKHELEKQGTSAKLSEEEQNSFAKGVLSRCALSFIDYLDAHSYEGKMCVSNGECEDIENAFHNAMWDRLHRYYCKYIEKQGEQKPVIDFKAKDWYVSKVDGKIHDMTYNPTDKVEPKFKIGDYIVNDYCAGKVVALTDDAYLLDTEQGIPFSCEHNVHLWTIQDAKDGDVLACGDKVTDCPFIFHNLTEELNPRSYCGVSKCQHFQDNDENGGFWCHSDEVRPATKEQRELLFQKMKEAGYQWDAEKKELKLLITNGGDFEPKQEWSVEDSSKEQRICKYLNEAKKYYADITEVRECMDWLKSLKDRITWKPSKEQMETLEYYMHTLLATEHKEVLFGLYNDLKKL